MSDSVENSIEIIRLYIENLWSWELVDVQWDKLNVLIGQNSSGKSNLFYAIAQSIKGRIEDRKEVLQDDSKPFRANERNGKLMSVLFENANSQKMNVISGTSIQFNIRREYETRNRYFSTYDDIGRFRSIDFRENLSNILTKVNNFPKKIANGLGQSIILQNPHRNTILISPKRRIVHESIRNEANNYDGSGIKGWEFTGENIKKLLINLKNAKSVNEQNRFRKLKNTFENLSFIKGTLVLATQAGGDIEIYLDYGDHQVKIEDEGAGIQDVLIIMTALEVHQGNIIMIEEPETHLHPSAQRELFEVIKDYKKYSQIFISTHSPLMVNLVDPSQIYLVTMDNQGISHLKQFTKTDDFEEIKSILGIQNSDALFANNIILVEGDSDVQVYQELLYKYKGISRAEIQFQRATNLDKVAKVFASLYLIELPAKGVILDADLKGKKKTETTFWKKVSSILNLSEANLKTLKQETLVYVIDPHMEMILVNSSSALGTWLDKPADEVKGVLDTSNTNPKEKIKLLLKHFGLNNTMTYDTSAANKIAKNMKVEEIPQEIKLLFDEYENFSS